MKYYKRTDEDNKTLAVESYSHDRPVTGAVEITEQEYHEFVDSLPIPETSPAQPSIDEQLRELQAKVESLEQRLIVLEK